MAKTPTAWAVLLPIHQLYANLIYQGTKTAELRKTVPRFNPDDLNPAKYPIRVYMYESKTGGGPGMITGFFDCPAFLGIMLQSENEHIPQGFVDAAQVSEEYIRKYANGGWVYGWQIMNPTRLPEPVPLSALGYAYPPQSWRYLNASACSILREVAESGTKP